MPVLSEGERNTEQRYQATIWSIKSIPCILCILGVLGLVCATLQLTRVFAEHHTYHLDLGTLEYGQHLSKSVTAPFSGPYHVVLEMTEAGGQHLMDGGALEGRVTRSQVTKDFRIPPDPYSGDDTDLTVWYEELHAGEVLQIELIAPPPHPSTQLGQPLHARVGWEIWQMDALPSEERYCLGVLGWGALLIVSLVITGITARMVCLDRRRGVA
jgi:hypothetical protein